MSIVGASWGFDVSKGFSWFENTVFFDGNTVTMMVFDLKGLVHLVIDVGDAILIKNKSCDVTTSFV